MGRLLDALPSSPTHPVTNQFVFGHCGRLGSEDLYQPAPLQQSNSTLHCRLGQARPFRQVLQAQRDTFLLRAIERSPENDVNQKTSRGVIVTGQVGQKHVNDVFVNRNMFRNDAVETEPLPGIEIKNSSPLLRSDVDVSLSRRRAHGSRHDRDVRRHALKIGLDSG